MSHKRVQPFWLDITGNKVWVLYASVEILRDCDTEKLEYALPKLHEDIVHATCFWLL
jgi:hypothetical protein